MLINFLHNSFLSRFVNSRRSPMRRKLARRANQFEQLETRALLSSVTTDFADYAPGSTAQITASDFAIGETIQFQVSHLPDLDGGGGHDPWQVTDGGEGDRELGDGHHDQQHSDVLLHRRLGHNWRGEP